MFEPTQKQITDCLKLPKGKVPTGEEISAQIGLLREDAQSSARRAWNHYNAALKTDPRKAVGYLVSYIDQHHSQNLCKSELSPEDASKLFLSTLRSQVRGEVKESAGKLVDTIRGLKRPKD